MFFLKNLKTTW